MHLREALLPHVYLSFADDVVQRVEQRWLGYGGLLQNRMHEVVQGPIHLRVQILTEA